MPLLYCVTVIGSRFLYLSPCASLWHISRLYRKLNLSFSLCLKGMLTFFSLYRVYSLMESMSRTLSYIELPEHSATATVVVKNSLLTLPLKKPSVKQDEYLTYEPGT